MSENHIPLPEGISEGSMNARERAENALSTIQPTEREYFDSLSEGLVRDLLTENARLRAALRDGVPILIQAANRK